MTSKNGETLDPAEKDKFFEAVCPDCGEQKLMEGPHGGLAVTYCQHCEAEIPWRATIQAEPDPLHALCRKFVKDNRISCPETVLQCDWVAENSPEFIAEVCKIVGFHREKG